MASWFLEPGHTAAEFSVRHMMVTPIRGHFKGIEGRLVYDAQRPAESSVDIAIDTRRLWTGDTERDAHLKSADFLDVERFPRITFRSTEVEVIAATEYLAHGDLTIRGVTRRATLRVHYLGEWQTPWWEGGEDKGPKTRAGFVATTRIDRRDFGIVWNNPLPGGGLVAANHVDVTIDVEAIREDRGA